MKGGKYSEGPAATATEGMRDKEGDELAILTYMDSPREREYIRNIKKLPVRNEKSVISFGLYGSNKKYTTGAVRNAQLRDAYFPGWVLRFYVDDSVPDDVVKELESLGCEIVLQNDLKGSTAGMFWR